MVQAEEGHTIFVLSRLIEDTRRALSRWDAPMLEELASQCRGLQAGADPGLKNGSGKPTDKPGLVQDLVILERVLKSTKANLDIVRRLMEPVDDLRLGYGLDVSQKWR